MFLNETFFCGVVYALGQFASGVRKKEDKVIAKQTRYINKLDCQKGI